MKLRLALTPAEVAAEIGDPDTAIAAMAAAEERGWAYLDGYVRVRCVGYQPGAAFCHAGTALYEVTR